MTFTEELEAFEKISPYKETYAGNAHFRYSIRGKEGAPTLVFLNGGTNVSEAWISYASELSDTYRVLLFDYPDDAKTNRALCTGMHALFKELGIREPILIGASLGGLVAEIYTKLYPAEVGGLILMSTAVLDEKTIKKLKRKYFLAPLMLTYMRHCNYEKLKPKMIESVMKMASDATEDEKAYIREMFTPLFMRYTREKDLAGTGRMIDCLRQAPCTKRDFNRLDGKVMLILPKKDFFSREDQEQLVNIMDYPLIKWIDEGGHLATIIKKDMYIGLIREFMEYIGF